MRISRLLTEVRKAMNEKEIRTTDIPALTRNRVGNAFIASIFRGSIPRNLEVLDILAKLLDLDPRLLRKNAFLDEFDRVKERFGLREEDLVLPSEGPKQLILPLYNMSDLIACFNDKGYPIKAADDSLPVAIDYGKYSYGVKIDDYELYPRVQPGETIIVSPDFRLDVEDYGLLRTEKNEVYVGKITQLQTQLTVERYTMPYRNIAVWKKDVLYMHKIVSIIRLLVAQHSPSGRQRRRKLQ